MEKKTVGSYIFKVNIVGDEATGKTAIMSRADKGVFSETYIPTIGIDLFFKNYSTIKFVY